MRNCWHQHPEPILVGEGKIAYRFIFVKPKLPAIPSPWFLLHKLQFSLWIIWSRHNCASVWHVTSPPTRTLRQRSETVARRYEGDSDKCHRWQWVCHSREMPFSPFCQQRCSPHRSQSLVRWLNLHIHMHASTHETARICLLGSVAGRQDVLSPKASQATGSAEWEKRGQQGLWGRLMCCCDQGAATGCKLPQQISNNQTLFI